LRVATIGREEAGVLLAATGGEGEVLPAAVDGEEDASAWEREGRVDGEGEVAGRERKGQEGVQREGRWREADDWGFVGEGGGGYGLGRCARGRVGRAVGMMAEVDVGSEERRGGAAKAAQGKGMGQGEAGDDGVGGEEMRQGVGGGAGGVRRIGKAKLKRLKKLQRLVS